MSILYLLIWMLMPFVHTAGFRPSTLGLECYSISPTDSSIGLLDRNARRGCLSMGDTGEQVAVPKSVWHGSKAIIDTLSASYIEIRDGLRSLSWESQVAYDERPAKVEKSGDAGGYARKFGKNWGDKIPDLVAIGWYGHHKHNECRGRSLYE